MATPLRPDVEICRHCLVERFDPARSMLCPEASMGYHAWTTVAEHHASVGQVAERWLKGVR